MYKKRRPVKGPAILYFIAASLFLAACGAGLGNESWPGMSVDGDEVYVAYGPGVVAVDIVEEEVTWSYPDSDSSNRNVLFYAAPSVNDGQIVFGDYGTTGSLFSAGSTVQIYSYALDGSGDGIGPGCSPDDPTDGCLWIQGPSRHKDINDKIVAAPLHVGDRVFVGTADNLMLALDADDGDGSVWPQPFEAEHSIWGQPVHEDGLLYVGSLDRNVYALDAATGEEIWQGLVDGSVSDRADKDTDLIYVGSFDRQVHALDKVSGATRWTAPAEAAVWGAPTFAEGVVYFVDLDGNVYAVDAETGTSVWSPQTVDGYTVAAPVVDDGIVYVATAGDPDTAQADRGGRLFAFSAADGEEVWDEPLELSAPAYTTPVFVGEDIVVAITGGAGLLEIINVDSLDRRCFSIGEGAKGDFDDDSCPVQTTG